MFIIAEIGVNHNNSWGNIEYLIRGAASAGADAVKFQTFSAVEISQPIADLAPYQSRNLATEPSFGQIQMLKGLELPESWYQGIVDLCKATGVEFMSTPYSLRDIDFLTNIGVSRLKLASIHCVEKPMLRRAAESGLPVIISTGMCTEVEVELAVETLVSSGCKDYSILQCETNYPSEVNSANLSVIREWKVKFGCPIGYSDHTTGDLAALVAVGLGAETFEKHITFDKHACGPDHQCSLELHEFRDYVAKLRVGFSALGSSVKVPTPQELANIQFMRRSLVASRDILVGEIISADSVAFKRPCNGLPPSQFDYLVGSVASRVIREGQVFTEADLS